MSQYSLLLSNIEVQFILLGHLDQRNDFMGSCLKDCGLVFEWFCLDGWKGFFIPSTEPISRILHILKNQQFILTAPPFCYHSNFQTRPEITSEFSHHLSAHITQAAYNIREFPKNILSNLREILVQIYAVFVRSIVCKIREIYHSSCMQDACDKA